MNAVRWFVGWYERYGAAVLERPAASRSTIIRVWNTGLETGVEALRVRMCAVVDAKDPESARAAVQAIYEVDEWRFCIWQERDWMPPERLASFGGEA